MKSFFSSLLTAVTLVLVSAGLSFGQTVTVWPLESSTADSVISNIPAASEVVTGLSTGYEVPAAGTTNNVQKVKPDASTSYTAGTGYWPAETTPNTGRYVQFAITPQANYSVTLDSISMMIGAKGMKGMHADVQYSMHSDFSSPTSVSSMGDLIENAVKDTTLSVSMSLNSGDTVFVRVYPWTVDTSTSNSKYVYIGGVTAYGAVMTTPMAVASGNNMMWNFQADSVGVSYPVMSWGPGNAAAVAAADTITPSGTNHILEFDNNNYNSAPILEVVLPAGKTMANYTSLNFKLFMAQGDIGQKTFLVEATSVMPSGPFDHGADTNYIIGSYYRSPKTPSTAWENVSIPLSGSFSMSDTVYIVFGFNAGATGGTPAVPTVWYADNIQLMQETSTSSQITQWGIAHRNNPGWHLTVSGDTATFAGGKVAAWAAIRGAFKNPLVGTTDKNGAIVVAGQVTFTGQGPDGGSALRYGYYNNTDPGTLNKTVADSAFWTGFTANENSYGYTFAPNSGTYNLPANYGFGGAGAAQWVVMGGSWISSYGGAVGIGPVCVLQAPARAVMNAGTYDFAFSVHPQSNGTKLVKYYLIQKNSSGNIVYWDAATLTDTTSQMSSDTLNAICWGLAGAANMTGVTFTNVVDSLGPDISIPTQPWSQYYIDQSSFAFYGNRMGGWSLIPGGGYGLNNQTGNVTMLGDTSIPQYQSMAVRGAFVGEVAPRSGIDSNVVVTGDLEFDGGGFSVPNSFMFGIFDADSAGSVNVKDTTHYAWTGSENYNNGYLFVAPSGNGAMPQWPGGVTSQYLTGDAGAVVNGVWLSTINSKNYMMGAYPQYPADAVPGPGMYHFEISAGPNGHGAQKVNFVLFELPDTNYVFQGSMTDTHNPLVTSQFNSVNFALLGGNSTDTLKIDNVLVNLGPAVPLLKDKITGVTNTGSNLPKTFALYQNYPNPFNPSTVISYALPKSSQVTVKVYNVLGQEVATVVNSKQSAGIYKVNFNMDKYASGVYFIRMIAGNFVHTEKMMLLK